MTTFGQLRKTLEQALDDISCFDDEDKVECHPNTYGLSGYFISLGWAGFVDLNDICEEEEE